MRFHYYAFLLISLLASSLFGQTFRGAINGVVEDPSGAVLANAKITAINAGTGASRTTASGTSGEFSFPDLPTGTYAVTAKKEGFSEQKSEAEVAVSRVSTITFRLALASQTSTVSVGATAETIETSSTTITGVVNTKTVSDLPMNGRNFPPDAEAGTGRFRQHDVDRRWVHTRQQLHDRRCRQ